MRKLIYLLLFMVGWHVTALGGTFYEYHSINCGATLELGAVGFPSWITATVVKAPAHGQALILTGGPFPDSMAYLSDTGYFGQDTFIVACAHATQITCDTGIYIITISCLNDVQGVAALDNDLRVFPNPSNGFLAIESTGLIERIRLRSLQGIVDREERFKEGVLNEYWALTDLPPGIYILEIWLHGRIVVKKIIIE